MDKYRGMQCEAQDQETRVWHKAQLIALSLPPTDFMPIVQIKGFSPWCISWDRFRGISKDELLDYYTSRPTSPREIPQPDGAPSITAHYEAAYRAAVESVVVVTNSSDPRSWSIPCVEDNRPVVPYFFKGTAEECTFIRTKIIDTLVRLLCDHTMPDGMALAGIRRCVFPREDRSETMVNRAMLSFYGLLKG